MNSNQSVSLWVIEDDDVYRSSLERLFASDSSIDCAFAFSAAEDALTALEDEFAPDVLLTDLGLPGMDGLEAMRRISMISPSTRILVLSVHEDDEKIFSAICNGAIGYLLKPSPLARIKEAVHAAANGGVAINPRIAARILTMFRDMSTPVSDYGLTDREKEILGLLVDERTKAELAESLFLSYHTVDMHVRNIYTKLQVHSRAGAVAKAIKERLL